MSKRASSSEQAGAKKVKSQPSMSGAVVIVCYVDHAAGETSIYSIPYSCTSADERSALASFNNVCPWEQEELESDDRKIIAKLLRDGCEPASLEAWVKNNSADIKPLDLNDREAMPRDRHVPWEYLHDMLTGGKWAKYKFAGEPGEELFSSRNSVLEGFYFIIKSLA